jgi:hypothetical protein
MTLDSLQPYINLIAQVSIPILGLLIHKRLRTPSDHQRAELLSRIANAAAALVLTKNPTDSWRNLLANTVREISNASGLPTSNMAAIEREAAAALMRTQATSSQTARASALNAENVRELATTIGAIFKPTA